MAPALRFKNVEGSVKAGTADAKALGQFHHADADVHQTVRLAVLKQIAVQAVSVRPVCKISFKMEPGKSPVPFFIQPPYLSQMRQITVSLYREGHKKQAYSDKKITDLFCFWRISG